MISLHDIAPDRLGAAELNRTYNGADAEHILQVATSLYQEGIAMISSFGADSAVLLHLLSRIDRDVPVLMLDTKLLFPETIAYQEKLTKLFGLRDVRRITPDETSDPQRRLHLTDTTACCALRKVVPLEKALTGFEATITGRKRFQTESRLEMPVFDQDSAGRVRVNPLAQWSMADITAYFDRFDLPRHPLVAKGYPSIGCAPCTTPVKAGEDIRAGRWRNESRQECGIHFTKDGRIERVS